MTIAPEDLAAAARVEARRMRSAVIDQEDDAVVRMNAGQFRSLAVLIERLVDDRGRAEPPVASSENPDFPLRSWVPLASFLDAKREHDTIRAESLDLRAQLQVREADYLQLTSLAFGLQSGVGRP